MHGALSLLRSLGLLLALAGLLALTGYSLGGAPGALLAVVAAVTVLAVAPAAGADRWMRRRGARPLHPAEAPGLLEAVARLSRRAGLERPPRVYLVSAGAPQAFATGDREDATIGVTLGLLRALSPREAAGVLAHEIGHLASGDLWMLRLAESAAGLTRTLSRVGIFLLALNVPLILIGAVYVPWTAVLLLMAAPTLGTALARALSRTRELAADRKAAELTGDPRGLASALRRIEAATVAPLWMRWLDARVPDWLRTHPATEERVAHLLELEPRARRAPRRIVVQRVG